MENGLASLALARETGCTIAGFSLQGCFHKETKLSIAVGQRDKLEIIDAVFKALEMPRSKPIIDPATGLPVPPRKAKGKD